MSVGKLLLGCVALCLGLVSCSDSLTRDDVLVEQQRAMAAVQALQSYRADLGDYPRVLSELVPTYLSELPTPIHARVYDYRLVRSNQELELAFITSRNTGCGSTSLFGERECGRGDE